MQEALSIDRTDMAAFYSSTTQVATVSLILIILAFYVYYQYAGVDKNTNSVQDNNGTKSPRAGVNGAASDARREESGPREWHIMHGPRPKARFYFSTEVITAIMAATGYSFSGSLPTRKMCANICFTSNTMEGDASFSEDDIQFILSPAEIVPVGFILLVLSGRPYSRLVACLFVAVYAIVISAYWVKMGKQQLTFSTIAVAMVVIFSIYDSAAAAAAEAKNEIDRLRAATQSQEKAAQDVSGGPSGDAPEKATATATSAKKASSEAKTEPGRLRTDKPVSG
jgi:hypothetical protein